MTPVPGGSGVVVINPEYVERMGKIRELEDLYKGIGDNFKQKCTGYTGYIFTGNPGLAKKIGLRAKRKIPFFNGPIECRLELDREGGKVFVGFAGKRINCELSEEIEEAKEFTELPKELSFPMIEYQTMLDQAKRMVESFKKRKSIGRTASPLNSSTE